MSSGAYDRGQRRLVEPAISLGEPLDKPSSPTLVLSYPHLRPSLEPKRLRREEIWAVAEEARRQLCRGPRPRVDITQIARRTTRLQVNGLDFELRWQFDGSVEDVAGQPAIGSVEHDPAWPAGATISIDSAFIGERDNLGRSTAAHELGHAIFDVPAWIWTTQYTSSTEARRYHLTEASEREAVAEVDWVEWRANEFMGAFLAPRAMLHRHMHKRAAGLEIPLIESRHRDELPVVCPHAPPPLIDELVGELAELLGLSVPFIRMRLRRYGLVPVQLLG